jgi:hypothetical protein
MEEDTAPPKRNDTLLLSVMGATKSSSMRFTEPQGRTEEPPVPPRHSTRSSTPPFVRSAVLRIWIYHHVGGGEKARSP